MNLTFVSDDYGESAETNAATLKLVAAGIVRRVSVLPCSQSDLSNIAQVVAAGVKFGAHLYLTEYPPLTESMLRAANGGSMTKKELLFRVLTGKVTARMVQDELVAQISSLRARRVRVSFLDTHQNVHGFPWIYRLVKAAATEAHLDGQIRPIGQIRFSLQEDARTMLSRLAAMRAGDDLRTRVLIGCPGYRAVSIDLESGLAQWEAFLRAVEGSALGEIVVPCHPGMGPAEIALYNDPRFKRMLGMRARQ